MGESRKDSSDPTTAMKMALCYIGVKHFKGHFPYQKTINQRSSLIPRNSQNCHNRGLNTSQDIKMQMVDDNVGNRRDNTMLCSFIMLSGVPEIAKSMGLECLVQLRWVMVNGINGNTDVRCYNCRGGGSLCQQICTVKAKDTGMPDYLQQQPCRLLKKKEAGILRTLWNCNIHSLVQMLMKKLRGVKVNAL
ncbi:hypothetical protein Tco_0769397 [Tanacetum coccineum]|uniref:Uncharacterized protein n=1 Tax=Tanacetum coccineum TaxID=301880 RepID=A0ABQ4ZBW8_9ASTR